jgi:hypothetical protein
MMVKNVARMGENTTAGTNFVGKSWYKRRLALGNQVVGKKEDIKICVRK